MGENYCAACKKKICGEDLKYLEFLNFYFPLCSLHYDMARAKLDEVVHHLIHEMGVEDA